jgi:MoaA/NifB/PqqE/SkfB family radical SAM enzyme
MEIIRQIGRHQILVDTDQPCGLYFEESMVGPVVGNDSVALEKADILVSLATGDEYMPLTTHWELLDRCNFACPFCYIVGHSFHKLPRFSEIQTHVADLIQEGLLFCTLTGGEVTIHPDFKAIYQYLKNKGVIVEVFTNGYAIDTELINLFGTYPPAAVEVSLYSLKNERLRTIYGAGDDQAATKILNNVLCMRQAGINVICKTFLNTITLSDIDDIVLWCESNGIEHYSSSEITTAYDGADLRSFAIKKTELPPPRQKAHKKAVCLPCKTKNCGSAITSSFSIYPCPSIKLSECTFDLRQLGVSESLRRMKAFMRRFQDSEIQGGECGSSSCASCMAYAKPVRNEVGELLHFAQP